jgi:hypothetical protein
MPDGELVTVPCPDEGAVTVSWYKGVEGFCDDGGFDFNAEQPAREAEHNKKKREH